PVALLRGGASQTQLANFWAYAASGAAAGLGSEHVAAYTRLMAASQPLIAQDVLDAWPVDRYRCLLDVGGGNGAFIAAAAARAPELRFQLFDLPAVAGEAEKRFEALGLAGRTAVIGGDFRSDPLPIGADIASLVRVLHDHDDAVAAALLRAVAAALPEDGTLLIAEPMARTPGAMPVGDAYFGFYFLALGQGRARTPRMLIDMARSAGFRKARLIRTARPLLAQVIVAQEPRTTPSVKNT
ncbi:MAG TPA: methyltransferase, partial [Steroidobacteraceae bacterium]|nr:methyltransferase [Steroidobacteraceae bacterium]